ncbi:MAG: hypothetical protein HXS54_06070 [Theionarchaea archaeon]|nr:hypothetical protein [Theionarchaea archaeon]
MKKPCPICGQEMFNIGQSVEHEEENWLCPHCDDLNSFDCPSCGNELIACYDDEECRTEPTRFLCIACERSYSREEVL